MIVTWVKTYSWMLKCLTLKSDLVIENFRHDTIICTAVAEALEQKIPQRTLLLPTTWLGASAHHLRFGATVTAELDTYIATLCEIGTSLLEDGFRRILFLNGHGGNVDPLQVALRQLQQQFPEAVAIFSK